MSIPSDVVAKVLAEVYPDELIELTSQLVRINSVWDPEAGTSEADAAIHVAGWCRDQGFFVEIDQVAPGRPNVIVTHQAGPGERCLMFEGHTDVVTPGDPADWSYDPFGAQIVGRRMYGRGSNDTKGNLCAMLIAMAAIKRSGVSLSGSILGGVLCDEEEHMSGVQDFIKRGRADKVSAAVICEPEDGIICISQKGAVRVRFSLNGRMAHGAMPLSGLNPAPAIALIIEGLQAMELAAIDTHGQHEHLGWPSFTPTVIKAPGVGAPQLNVIPAQAEVLVDIRTIPSQSHEQIKHDMLALAQSSAQKTERLYEELDRRTGFDRERNISIKTEFLTDRPCTQTRPDDPVVLAADWATRRVARKEPVYHGVPGATDGTFLWALKDIPIVTMGAGDRMVPHQKDEWVDLDQLIETAKIYALIALDYLWPGG